MTYTEIKKINGNKYYYRALSIRNYEKISKKREYLGKNLDKTTLLRKENEADIILTKIKKENRKKKTINKIKLKIIKILKGYGIIKAGIFGSYARGEQNKNSDIDILVHPLKPLGFKFVNIKFDIEKKLKKKVDIITYKSIHPLIKESILKEEVRII